MLIIHLYIFNKKEMNSKYFNFVNNGGGLKKPIWLFNKQTLRIFTNFNSINGGAIFSVMKAFLVNSFNLRPKYCESEETFLRKSYFFWFLSLQHSVHQVHAIVAAVKEWIKIKVFLDESNVILFLQWTMSHLVFVNILRISYDVRILRALLQYYQNILTCCCSCSSLSLCCPRSALSERLTSHFHLLLEVWVICKIPCRAPCHQQVLYLSWKIPDCEPRHGRASLQDLLDLGSLLSPEWNMQHAKIGGAYTHILCPK